MLIKHENLTGQTVHVAHAFEYADRAERVAATGFKVDDIGRLAIQLDTGGYWRLLANDPTEWVPAYGNTMFQRLQAEEVTNITYDANSRITRTDYGNGVYCTIDYTDTGNAEYIGFYSATATLIERWQYSYDSEDRLNGVTQLT